MQTDPLNPRRQAERNDTVELTNSIRDDAGQGLLRTQAVLADSKENTLTKYSRLVAGSKNPLKLLKYELITGLLGWLPGLPGLTLRQIFYRFLFQKMGKGVVIGRDVAIRHPGRIRLGDRVVIEDGAVLDAKGDRGDGILIGDGVFVGRGTIISTKGGTIEIGEGSSIGSYCRIGTLGTTKIGRKVLIAAYVYIVGGGHRSNRVDIPVIDQPAECKGGVFIGDGSWIGAFTMVMDGKEVGNDVIIGAHSLVTRNIPPFAIAYGAPARVHRDRRDGIKESA